MANFSNGSLTLVDLSTGNRTILSSSTVGSGTPLTEPVGVSRESDGVIIVGEQTIPSSITQVDPATGNRTVLSSSIVSSPVGTGPELEFVYGLAVEADGNILAAVSNLSSIYRIDPVTGNRTVVTSTTVGSGATMRSPFGLLVDTDGSIVFVPWTSASEVIRVDPTTGARTLISSAAVGTGVALSSPTSILKMANGSFAVLNNNSDPYVIRVDPATGNRTAISGSTVGTGPTIGTRYSMAQDTNGNLYVADFGANSIVEIDPVTGNRTTVASSAVGSGPNFDSPLGMLGAAVASVSATVPGAPTGAVATAGNTQASVSFTAPASNGGAAISAYTATSNPGNFTGTAASSPIVVTGLTNGTSYTFTVTATNSVGTGAASSASNSVTPDAAPTVTSVAVPASGTAILGTNLNFTINWSSAVTVTGTPTLALVIGNATQAAAYVSGSGTTATLFQYTIAPGDLATNGITVGALSLNGGSITDALLNNAVLTLNSVGSTAGVDVDGITPTLTAVSIASSNVNPALAKTGDNVILTFTSSETIATPTVGIDGHAVAATASGNAWTAVYQMAAGDPEGSVTFSIAFAAPDGNVGTPVSATTDGSAVIFDGTGPVITSAASAGGTYLVAFAPFTVTATDSPTSFGAAGLPAGLSIAFNTISGTPTASGLFSVTLTATDAAGNVGTSTLALTIAQAVATVILSSDEMSATTVPTGLTVDLTYNGSATIPTAPGTYAVAATVEDPNYTGSATGTLVIGGLAQKITFTAPGPQLSDATPITLSATDSSGLPVTIALVSGPAILNGNTLTLTGASGTVVLSASQAGNSVYTAAPGVTVSFGVNAAGQQIYFGSTGDGDAIAAILLASDTNGTIIGYLAGTEEGFVVNFQLDAAGAFSAPAVTFNVSNGTAALAQGVSTPTVSRVTNAVTTLTFQGTLIGGVLSGTIVELSLPFSAAVQPLTGSSAGIAGYYQAPSINTEAGNIYSIVGTQGGVYVLAVTPSLVAAGTTTLAAGNTFIVRSAQNATITGSIDEPSTTETGTISISGMPTTHFAGLATTTARDDRLVNLSSRAEVGATDGAILITGFTIGGAAPKKVLLRAVGPGLAALGFHDALSDPQLMLFDHTGAIIARNAGWPAADAAIMESVGAFPLTAGSADCDIVTTLAPGSYTMQVSGGVGTGVALAEVYDASVDPQGQYQRLINISSRGSVGAGDGVLIGGFVVTGNSPKTLLIRGIGPELTAFGVPGALSDPTLAVYSGSLLIAQNGSWGTPTAINALQTAATSAQIASAAQITGAFALPANSKDSALIITLAPGSYTAEVSSASGAPGVALVEIYEMP